MDIKALTFDYFGTLVDVDKGGMAGIAEVMRILGVDASRPIFEIYLEWDMRNVRLYRGGAYRSYRAVAQDALTSCFNDLFPKALDGHDAEKLTDTLLTHLVEESPPHADAVSFLESVTTRYPLMPITNMDSDLWKRSQLVSYFEHVTTAEMAKAYKPSQLIFSLALDRLGVGAQNVLHCSLASWADIDGAKPLGMNVAWINRSGDKLGPWQPRPDFEFETLSPVRDILR
ncbi:HAD family hydrolase [Burkholderia sp. Ac-20353]|uniref:HAD family hydrolase n=1 Tax=Burkholderia sp. Ac-20353 TaxID=2703894 RepID=UPI00197B3C08|nr:HAD family hydrolase [Burkholderia sp. Ac-20353]MBN3788733.1 HAD hydrolase-like protein [Burkholderia sp. Ac-20353]